MTNDDAMRLRPRADENRSNLLMLWTHFQAQAGDDKNKMITSVSWLLGIVVALLATSIGELVPGKDLPRPLVASMLSLFTLLLCATACYLVSTFSDHASLRYRLTGEIEKDIDIPYWKRQGARQPGKWRFFKDVGVIFDFFAALSVFLAIVSVVILAYSLSALVR